MSVFRCKPKQQYTHDDPEHPYKETEEYKAYKRQLYKENPEYYKALDRKWKDKNPDYHKLHQREYRKKHPHATNGNASRTKKMWTAQNKAILETVIAPFCELCPENDIKPAKMRHHPDYNYPTIFVSVCQACHSNIHADLEKEKCCIQ